MPGVDVLVFERIGETNLQISQVAEYRWHSVLLVEACTWVSERRSGFGDAGGEA